MKKGWRKVKLGDIAEFCYGKMPQNNKIGDGAFKIFTGYRYYANYPEKNCEKGDVIIIARGVGGTGDIKIANCDCYLTNLSIKITFDPSEILNQYFFYSYLLTSMKYLDSGSAQSQITITDLKNHQVTVPPLPTQRRIASILSAYDDLIENNNCRIEILENMAQAIYREWFVEFRAPGVKLRKATVEEKKVTGKDVFPDGWGISSLFDVAEITYGYPFNSSRFSEDNSGTPVIRIRNIQKNNTDTFTDEVVDNKYIVNDGDIIIGMDGDFNIGKWAGGKSYLNQRVVMIKYKNEYSRYWLMLALKSPIEHYDNTIVGTTVAHLSDRDLRQIKFLMPPKSINNKCKEILDQMYNEEIFLIESNTLLSNIRDLLLPKLVGGEVEV